MHYTSMSENRPHWCVLHALTDSHLESRKKDILQSQKDHDGICCKLVNPSRKISFYDSLLKLNGCAYVTIGVAPD